MQRKFLVWFLPLIVVALQRLIGLTSRFITVGNSPHLDPAWQSRAFILSIWHTNVLYSPYLHRYKNVAVMISESKDGDFINEVVHRFGNTSIRGSSSHGGSKALKAMILHLKKGGPVAFTPDGPRGPAFIVQPGLIAAAQMTQAPIIPFHYECTRQWILQKAWDKHRIPKPFTTFVISYGDPIFVPRDLTKEEFEEQRLEVERAMLKNMEVARVEADRLAGIPTNQP
ncbi:MAG: lysophospholipid acyltransferase family protein [Leptospira sp.]|nr:lysophospholipid acyltransferase family protein [Leptospira sp.]